MDKHNLDGIYFRIIRNGRYENVCWSDMSKKEMHEILDAKCQDPDALVWLSSMCIKLGEVIRELGDEFSIYAK